MRRGILVSLARFSVLQLSALSFSSGRLLRRCRPYPRADLLNLGRVFFGIRMAYFALVVYARLQRIGGAGQMIALRFICQAQAPTVTSFVAPAPDLAADGHGLPTILDSKVPGKTASSHHWRCNWEASGS
jgi:hypothetical protein